MLKLGMVISIAAYIIYYPIEYISASSSDDGFVVNDEPEVSANRGEIL